MDRILSNQVKCLKCGDEPYSASVHDFKSCKCGAIAVDGGQDYLKRVGDLESYEEISIELDREAVDLAVAAIEEAQETGRNAFGILCAVARTLRDWERGHD